MPVLLNTIPTTASPVVIKKHVANSVTFDYETIEELIYQYNEENIDKYKVTMECVGESMCIHIFEERANRVVVYHVKNCLDLYIAIETSYVARISSDDFAFNDLEDKWEAFMSTIESCKIMDTVIE